MLGVRRALPCSFMCPPWGEVVDTPSLKEARLKNVDGNYS